MVRRLYPDVTTVRLRRNRRASARNVGPAPWRAAILVGPDGAEDPLNELLAESLLPRNGLPGPRVLGFLGCAVVTRREAFLRTGGYRGLLGIGGEEELLALDLAARGWASAYDETVVARHLPSPHRDIPGRRVAQ
jgi:hypothetical protein